MGATESCQWRDLAFPVRVDVLDGFGDRTDMLRRRPTASPKNVDPAILGEFPYLPRHGTRIKIILTHFVGQASVGVRANEAVGDVRKLLKERPHEGRPQSAVHSHAEQREMADTVPHGFDRLTGDKRRS